MKGSAQRALPTRGRVHEQRVERLPDRRFQAKIAQPFGGGGARRSLALTDLVPVQDQHARARRAKLARDCQTGERRAADQDVSIRARGKGTRAAPRFVARTGIDRYSIQPLMEATLTPPAIPEARVVEGSDGMLLEIDGKIVPNYDATIVPFEEGDVVTGKVVRIDKDEVLVDIGYKSEGVIPNNELSIRKSVDPNEEVELGEEVDALVLTKEDQDGRLILSKKRARFERAWRKIEAAADSGEPVNGAVIEVVKGGLIVDLGVRGFLPASLVDIRRVPNLDEYLGQTIQTKVIELNRSRNNVVLSRRAVLEEERKEQRQAILERLQPGLIIEGQISNIVDFGAFVDLDGIDGLIHISELSWSHVNHPSEILSIGQTVEVKVLDIDRDRQRISLGLKQTQEDPWQRVVDTYHVGDELEGAVTKVVAFGAFVEILEGVEGLVHISELAQQHVENPREIVAPGDEVKVKILEIDSERRRLSLSIKRVEGQVLPLRTEGLRRRGRPRGHARAGPVRGRLRRAAALPTPRREVVDGDDEAEASAEAAKPRRGVRRGGARADERRGSRLRPTPEEAATPRKRLPPGRPGAPRRSDRAAVRRPDGRHRRGEVGGACRAGASRRGDDLHRPGRSRPLRGSCGARRRGGALGPSVAPDGRVDRRAVARSAFASDEERGWLEGLLWPLVGERVAAWRAAESARRARSRWWSRRRCCSRRGSRATTTRRSRSSPTRRCARSAPAPAATRPSTNGPPDSSHRPKRLRERPTL